MNNIWILAETAETTTSGISSEPADNAEQTTSTAVQDPGAVPPAQQPPAKKTPTFNPLFMIAIMASEATIKLNMSNLVWINVPG